MGKLQTRARKRVRHKTEERGDSSRSEGLRQVGVGAQTGTRERAWGRIQGPQSDYQSNTGHGELYKTEEMLMNLPH